MWDTKDPPGGSKYPTSSLSPCLVQRPASAGRLTGPPAWMTEYQDTMPAGVPRLRGVSAVGLLGVAQVLTARGVVGCATPAYRTRPLTPAAALGVAGCATPSQRNHLSVTAPGLNLSHGARRCGLRNAFPAQPPGLNLSHRAGGERFCESLRRAATGDDVPACRGAECSNFAPHRGNYSPVTAKLEYSEGGSSPHGKHSKTDIHQDRGALPSLPSPDVYRRAAKSRHVR